ncbi:putative pol-like protein [Seiridium cardinale]|uniref:Pol-like protein n=1 Tax=Seiridium cardinale TaxID=138064 RepID=A0ABR2XYU1_9PEZI
MATNQQVQQLLAALREELNTTFTAKIEAIENESRLKTTALEAELRGLSAALQARPGPPPKSKLPDPPKFSGSATDFDSWLLEIDGKMAVDATAIGEPQAQFRYWFSRLEPKAQRVVAPHVRYAERTGNWDYSPMRTTLIRINEDPLKPRKAANQLRDLKQGDFSLHSFLTKWETLAGESGHATQTDEVRISAVRHAVAAKLQHKLDDREVQFGSLPTTYDEFIALLHKINSGGSNPPVSGNSHHSNNQQRPHRNSNAMDTTVGAIVPISATEQPKITQAQRREWQRGGRCRGCGSEEHAVRSCPSNAARLFADLEQIQEEEPKKPSAKGKERVRFDPEPVPGREYVQMADYGYPVDENGDPLDFSDYDY